MSVEENAAVSEIEEVLRKQEISPDDYLRIADLARKSAPERRTLQARMSGAQPGVSREEAACREAAYHWIVGRPDKVEETLKGVNTPAASFLRGVAAMDRGQFEEAVPLLKAAAEKFPDAAGPAAEYARALCGTGRVSEGMEVIGKLEASGKSSPQVLYCKAFCLEHMGDIEGACSLYERALEASPGYAPAVFRLAYHMDLRGEDGKAVALYKTIACEGSLFARAMCNLGLLYEDADNYDEAIKCYREALKADPGNERAALYLKNAIESLDMYYDETERKESERMEAILRMPVSDFELSVRSRNCLAKMNVRTLGDLVKKTENELLSYKNFGETSLREIKNLLESKGLHLGMARPDQAVRAHGRPGHGEGTDAILAKPISEIELSVRSRKCMAKLSIQTLGDLVQKTEKELLAVKNFGQTSLNEVKQRLAEFGLSLKSV
ncbi:MAG: tetratricopeptide repeat protein [Planctomycetota bacterium]|nr:tetratricopeptide repeat protein [Planctomycetota bacterium]